MDPNSTPWAYAYNRIAPSASGSSEDFQHPHLTTISAAAGSSAQSILLQAAHTSIAGFNATSGNFVPPSPIAGYNPVFQQIYHQAAQAAVQPKPAHYTSSTVTTTHRHIGVCDVAEKHEGCRPPPTPIGYQSNQTSNLTASTYYGENSSSSGASPSPTTSSTSSSTLTWNSPAVNSSQHMSSNTFIHMQQQPDIIANEKVNNAKHSLPHTKAQAKVYGDLIYVGNEGQSEQVTLHLDNQVAQEVSEGNCPRSENGFYTFVDGKLTYNIPAAAINSCLSPSNKSPGSLIKTSTNVIRKEISGESQQPSTHQHCLNQVSSPAYSIYESPSVCSSVDSSPQPIKSVHNNEGDNNLGHNMLYKSRPTVQPSINNSNVDRNSTSNNSSSTYTRNGVGGSSLPSTTGVAYSSVITNTLQSQQHQLLQNNTSQEPECWPSDAIVKTLNISKQNQRCYTAQSPPIPEENIYTLSSSLQVKHVLIEPSLENANSSQPPSQLQHQLINNALHVMTPHVEVDKTQSHPVQPTHPRPISQNKQHSIENVLPTNNSLASQIQCTTKNIDVQKTVPQKKTPRKRQPKKNFLNTCELGRANHQANNNAQQSENPHHPQTQQPIQLQQHSNSFFDYSGRWIPQKSENGESSQFMNNQQSNLVPQPAHIHPSAPHAHMTHISQYFQTLPPVTTQYSCMPQNSNLYMSQSTGNSTQNQQNSVENHCSLEQSGSSLNMQDQLTSHSSYKVIVPNIEDELNFLCNIDNNSLNYPEANNLKNSLKNHSPKMINAYRPFENQSVVSRKSGFMDSYLKFLQGERDESPPPMLKGSRKFSYQKPMVPSEPAHNEKMKSIDTVSMPIKPTSVETKNPDGDISNTVSASETNSIGTDDGHKIKIISQTQILPKKRPHAQNITELQQAQVVSEGLTQRPELQAHDNHLNTKSKQQEAQQTKEHLDPLALPPRREHPLRKAKARSIDEIMELSPIDNERDESVDFVDSDTDPVWTPEDDNDDTKLMKCGNKRKMRQIKNSVCSKRKDNPAKNVKVLMEIDNTDKTNIPARDKIISEVPNLNTPDNYKTGDFIVLRSDLVNDWPIIWQVDSKCILQKYEPYCQNGKMFYRNMSKYASWNLETKKLYLKAPVRIQIQSHTETIVEFMRSELIADDTEQFIEKMMEEYLSYRDHFEIYIQTMISQVLDPSFFSEISREKDEYFLSSVRAIDEVMENCKRKLLSITPWTRSVILSIETWPQCHVFTEWGQNNINQKNCGGCHQPGISVRFLLFGHPYNSNTMQTIPVDLRVSYEKDILLCRICAARADIFHKIAHEKYNLFSICTRRVGDHQKENPDKSSTDILNDLLAENMWVDELFRNMRSSWAEVESLERQKRFHEGSQ